MDCIFMSGQQDLPFVHRSPQACHKQFVKIIFSVQFRGILAAAIGAPAHISIKLFPCVDQIHNINRISKFLAFPAESIHRILFLLCLPDGSVGQCLPFSRLLFLNCDANHAYR